MRSGGEISSKNIGASESTAAFMDEGEVFVECSPPVVNGVSNENVVRDEIVVMMIMGEEAPFKVNVQPVVEEGEVLESVPCFHGGGGGVKIGVCE